MHNSILIWCFILISNYALINGDDVPETVHRESIIAQSSSFEKELEKSDAFIRNEPLHNYLNDVLHRISGDSRYKVKVLLSPSLNAFATAHGTIYICTGLLARIQNEAQLAALLSHEMVHIINDHAYRNLFNAKQIALSSARKQIGLEFFFGSLATNVVSLTLRSAISGYSRDLEREAIKLTVDYQINAIGFREIIYAFFDKFFVYELRYCAARKHFFEESIDTFESLVKSFRLR